MCYQTTVVWHMLFVRGMYLGKYKVNTATYSGKYSDICKLYRNFKLCKV